MLDMFRKIKQLELYKLNICNINLLGNLCINRFVAEKMIFPPYRIDIEPTTKCNLKCVFCQVPGWNRSHLRDMSIDDFKGIISKFPFLKSVKLQGMGEPFLNHQLLEMIDYCNKKGIYSTIYNNGTVLNEIIIKELFKSPPLYFVFSLDTPSRDTYRIIRGKDMFQEVIKNINLAVTERNNTGSNTKIKIWCVLTKYNFLEIESLVRLAKELGVDSIVIQTKLNCFGKNDLKRKNDSISVNVFNVEIIGILNRVMNLAREINQDIELYKGDFFSKNRPCTFVKNSTYVSVEGEIVPCCIIADPNIITMGNIHNVRSINDIWNNNLYRNLRRAIYENRLPSYCKNCYI